MAKAKIRIEKIHPKMKEIMTDLVFDDRSFLSCIILKGDSNQEEQIDYD